MADRLLRFIRPEAIITLQTKTITLQEWSYYHVKKQKSQHQTRGMFTYEFTGYVFKLLTLWGLQE